MPTCVEGHQSTTTDYCDVCGAEIGSAGATAVPPPPPPPDPAAKACPACGAPVVGRFCEACGHDSALPPPPPPPVETPVAPPPVVEVSAPWSVTVAADREFYERVLKRDGPDTVPFPDFFPFRRIPLQGSAALIGRSKPEQGISPEIDLGVRPADRGVSSQHAVLRVTAAGLTITDLGSTNGTTLNGSEDLLAPDVEVPLADGDRIHIGAWTTITVTRGS